MKKLSTTILFLFSFQLSLFSQCMPTVSNSGATDDYIKNFTFGPNSKLNILDYSCDYTFDTVSSIYSAGSTYTFSIQTGSNLLGQDITIWADWNNDDDFIDLGETVFNSSFPVLSTTNLTGSINIPLIPNGNYKLRIASKRSGGSINSCSINGYGQFHDIRIFVGAQTSCLGIPIAGSLQLHCCQIGPYVGVIGFLNGTSYNNNLAYRWQRSHYPSGPWVNALVPFTPILVYSIPSASSCFRCIISCTASGISDTSNVVCAPCAALQLPLERIELKGKKSLTGIQLNWITNGNYLEGDYYYVERSYNGIEFEKISISNLISLDEIEENKTTYFEDKMPNTGDNYYRIIYVDIEKNKTHSNIVKMVFQKELNIEVSPNPTNNIFNIICSADHEEDLVIELYDLTGRKTISTIYKLQKGTNNFYVDISAIPNGFYNLKCTSNSRDFKTKIKI
ncbi:MAG TPA: T9SS type A sorting domain-containing protein [Chitinophagaceae bacterium]|nr:T9SS type A sorting domain-containing protein [Chitinophagaceae bacterium]